MLSYHAYSVDGMNILLVKCSAVAAADKLPDLYDVDPVMCRYELVHAR